MSLLSLSPVISINMKIYLGTGLNPLRRLVSNSPRENKRLTIQKRCPGIFFFVYKMESGTSLIFAIFSLLFQRILGQGIIGGIIPGIKLHTHSYQSLLLYICFGTSSLPMSSLCFRVIQSGAS